MEHVEKRVFNRLYSTERGRWFLSCVITVGIIVGLFLYKHPVFMTIDDARLRYVYAGYSSGMPESNYLFTYYPLSWFLSTLYKVWPQIQWYSLHQFFLIGMSSCLICKTVLKLFYKNCIDALKGVLLYVMLYMSIAYISTLIMHFEITAALTGTAGLVVFIGVDLDNDPQKRRVIDCVFSIYCIAMCFIINFNAFYVIFCYLMVALFYLILKAIKKQVVLQKLASVCFYLLCLTAILSSTKIIETYSKDSDEWNNYMVYNKYRVSFWDYPHIDYCDDPELFESIGWSERFYNLTESMYFMDNKFNSNALNKFTKRFSILDFNLSASSIKTAKNEIKILKKEWFFRLQVVSFGALIIASIIIILSRKRKLFALEAVCSLLCLGGAIIIAMFLAMKGRLPLRAWLMCSIPAITLSTIFLVHTFCESNVNHRLVKLKVLIAYIIMSIWTISMVKTMRYVEGEINWRRQITDKVLLIEEYAIKHHDNIYILDIDGCQNYSLFSHYNETYPTNTFVWGSSYLFTPVYFRQLSINNMTMLNTDSLFDDNVYYIARRNSKYYKQLCDYISEEYGKYTIQEVDSIDESFIVFKFK